MKVCVCVCVCCVHACIRVRRPGLFSLVLVAAVSHSAQCGAVVSHMMQMKELPPSDNLCQTYIAHFHRMLQRKAVIMAKFLMDNLQSPM